MITGANQASVNGAEDWRTSTMDVDEIEEDEEKDAFLDFIDYARSMLLPDGEEQDDRGSNGEGIEPDGPGWSWIASRILRTCLSYSSGVTPAILLSELSQAWNEQHRSGVSKKMPECINRLKGKHRRTKLQNTVTIDSIYEKSFLSLNSVLEAVVVEAFVLPGTNIYMLTLGDFWSSNTIDLYLHRKFYNLADPVNGILKQGREVFLTGCYLRTATNHLRLLPTEYLLIILDEDEDDDAMLLGALFCSDSFSSISLDAVSKGISYSLYARIVSIGSLEIQGKFGSLQRKQISLVDNDGFRLMFVLWGEQVHLANLFSVGSMLALDRPYVSSSVDSAIETCEEICLEYGSATQLYLVPFVQHEEHVSIPLTQNRCQGSKLLSTLNPSQGPIVSHLTLPRDSRGSIDFSNYPFRSFVVDLHDKMTSISLYGVVTEITRDSSIKESVFYLRIEDSTGAVRAKLHFSEAWSLGRVGLGHAVFLSGLTCETTKQKRLEVQWFENNKGSYIVNISSLPALLNSSCLHHLSSLSNLSCQTRITQICRVWLDRIEHVNTRFSHARCGHFVEMESNGLAECNFCCYNCHAEIVRTYHLKITIKDVGAKVFAWCTGPTATELLQISPDEFDELPEEEQIMYPSSLESERFLVAIVNCRRQGHGSSLSLPSENDAVMWEITRALKSE